jgi:hypothetical protein
MLGPMRFLVGPMLLLLCQVWCSTAAAQYHFPSANELVRAVKRGDDNDIERLAQRLLAMRLWRIVERGAADERHAALVTLGFAEDGWAVAPQLLRHATTSTIAVEAETAARALLRQSERWTPLYLETNDVPGDVLSTLSTPLVNATLRADLAVPIRVPLIGAAGRLIELRRVQENDLRALLNDGEPEVRLATIDMLRRLPRRSLAGLDLVIAGDREPRVAAAAAAALCYDVPPVPGTTPAEQRVQATSAPSQARLRVLAQDATVPLIDRLDLLACLRVFGTPEDKQILSTLSQKGVESLKRRAKQLLPTASGK